MYRYEPPDVPLGDQCLNLNGSNGRVDSTLVTTMQSSYMGHKGSQVQILLSRPLKSMSYAKAINLFSFRLTNNSDLVAN